MSGSMEATEQVTQPLGEHKGKWGLPTKKFVFGHIESINGKQRKMDDKHSIVTSCGSECVLEAAAFDAR